MAKKGLYIMGGAIILLLVILISMNVGNQGSNGQECSAGYIQDGSNCCKDSDYNGVCDYAEREIVEELPSYSDCDKFLSQSEKASCKWDVAEAIGDMRYCITDYPEDYDTDISSNIDNCLDNVLRHNRGEITLSACDYYHLSYNKEDCRKTIIVENKEYTLCGTLSDDWHVNDCYSDIARNLKDNSICNNIQDTETRYECIDEVTKYS